MRFIMLCLIGLCFALPLVAEDSPAPSGEIAFVSNREGGIYQIYIMNADGSNVRRLTDGNTDSYRPVWSPDGQHIAFMRKIEELEDSERILTALWVMDANGENAIEIARDENEKFILDISIRMSWSPNSERFIYKRHIEGKADLETILVNVDGTESSVVDVPVQEIDQTYFLTNETLIITYANSLQSNILHYDITNAAITFQAPFSAARHLKPSPDGTQIAFIEGQQLMVMDLSTREEHFVLERIDTVFPPAEGQFTYALFWSANGSHIAEITGQRRFYTYVPGVTPVPNPTGLQNLIFVTNLNSKEHFMFEVEDHLASLSPDGEHITYTMRDETGSCKSR